MARHGMVGRADLLRVLVAYERSAAGAEGHAGLAELMGYAREQVVPIVEHRVQEPVRVAEPAPATASVPAAAVVARGVSFWQPRELVWHDERAREAVIRRLEPSHSDADAEVRERARMRAVAPPPVPHLSPGRRLAPLLEREIVAELPSREIDVDALVRRIGRGESLGALPWLRRRGWPSLVVLMDRDFGLVPFWRDQDRLLALLGRLVGAVGLVVRLIDERGPEARLLDTSGRPVATHEGATAGLPVLALTDLGWYRGVEHQRAWLRVGRRLRRAGERIHALVPVPPARWTRALSQVWAPLAWERPVAGGRAGMDPERRAQRVGRLLSLAACAQRLEPGLLRALRLLLPRDEADVGTEADAWLHEDMEGSFPTATVMRGERVAAWRAAVAREDVALRERLRDVLRAWHWHRERQPELWHAEALGMARVLPGLVGEQQRDEAEAFARRLGGRARALVQRDDGRLQLEGIGRWLDHVEQHAPAEMWSTETSVGRDLQIAWWATHEDDRPPPSPDPSLRGVARGAGGERERRVELWQVGRRVIEGAGSEGAGSPVAVIAAVDERGYLVEAGASRVVAVGSAGERAWLDGKPAARVELRTDRMTLRLAALEKPEWASAIGRDRFGLWAEMRVREVRYRMRWIAPGRFVMGSPGDEPGRAEWEGPQHEVTITRGFWLGETPVTQVLWKAVTGGSPSHFKGSDRPVERVTWEDCRDRLIAGLNAAIGEDDGSFRLPTEAEWEYACRAGTSTATYAGPIEIRAENDAPVLDEIAWYGGNSGVGFEFDDGVDSSGWPNRQRPHTRAGTRRVGQKRPNAWGLYDMLGNVWEWCEDCWDYGKQYSRSESHQDPTGAATGEYRVIRGGSWYGHARYVRAACRSGSRPGGRGQDLGLRLARNQQPVLET